METACDTAGIQDIRCGQNGSFWQINAVLACGKEFVVIKVVKKPVYTYNKELPFQLTERERTILHLVVRNFIDTAGPAGSRKLVKRSSLDLSPATVRNTLCDLEEQGYLKHPYRSAGRMPTQRGYRAFVNELMDNP